MLYMGVGNEKEKNERYRLRRKNDGDRAWIPMAWATNSNKVARETAEEYKEDPTVQIYDYVVKKPI